MKSLAEKRRWSPNGAGVRTGSRTTTTRLGDLLSKEGLITEAQREEAVRVQASLWTPGGADFLLITKRAALGELRKVAKASTISMVEDVSESLRDAPVLPLQCRLGGGELMRRRRGKLPTWATEFPDGCGAAGHLASRHAGEDAARRGRRAHEPRAHPAAH